MLWLAANPYNIKANQIGVPTSTATVGAGLANIVKILMSVVGMLAIVFILVSGVQMAASAGNPKRFAQARETLLYAIVGLAVAIAAFAIVTFFTGIPHRN
jgi:cytochrome b subunit of formate dehydrogenase